MAMMAITTSSSIKVKAPGHELRSERNERWKTLEEFITFWVFDSKIPSWGWRGGGRRRCAIDCARFHQFNPRAVRVPKIQLAAAVDTGLDFQRPGVIDARGALFQRG